MFCRERFTNGSFGLVPFQRRGEAMRHRTIATLVLLQLVFGRSSAQVSRALRFSLRRDELKFWSPRTKRWVVELSIFDVWAGEDSRADLHAELTIKP